MQKNPRLSLRRLWGIAAFSHPDYDRRLRHWTESADPQSSGDDCGARGLAAICMPAYRRWGVPPRPEDPARIRAGTATVDGKKRGFLPVDRESPSLGRDGGQTLVSPRQSRRITLMIHSEHPSRPRENFLEPRQLHVVHVEQAVTMQQHPLIQRSGISVIAFHGDRYRQSHCRS